MVKAYHYGTSISPGESKIAPGATDQRNQQAKRQKQDERHPRIPASISCSSCGRSNLHHRSQRMPLCRAALYRPKHIKKFEQYLMHSHRPI